MEGRTSVSMSRSTRDRLRDMKPYDSMSYDEFLQELMDSYEEQRSTADGSQ